MPIICDGCNVRGAWEHRCHEGNAWVGGEPTGRQCECPECHTSEEELATFRRTLNSFGGIKLTAEESKTAYDMAMDDGIGSQDPESTSITDRMRKTVTEMLASLEKPVKQNLHHFKIGDFVEVQATVHSAYVGKNEREIIRTPLDPPKRGVIVGVSRVVAGTRVPENGSNSSYYEDSYEPAYLAVTCAPYVWLVRFSLTGKAVKVDNLDLYGTCEPFDLPIIASQYPWTDKDRLVAREYANKMPRDAKGRWVKGVKP